VSALFRRDDSESEQAERERTTATKTERDMRRTITELVTIEL
jgi:hypothetical protein